MMTEHTLLVLGSLGEFCDLVRRAKARGYRTIVCDGYPNGPAKQLADKAYNIDVRKPETIAEMCKEENVDGIIGSFSDLLFEQITKIADMAGLRWYVKPDMLPYYREKNEAKKLLASLGARVPKNTVLTRDFSDSDLEGFRFPLVIKPINGYGSKGIYVVHSVLEIRSRYDDVVCRASSDGGILAEEYSYGREYNLMTWVCDGTVYPLGMADREKNPQTGCSIPLNNRNIYPAKNQQAILPEAVNILQKFAEAVGQQEGALSMQFFYNEQGVEVCEIAGRFFGYEHELITYCSGFSQEELLLDYVYESERGKERVLAQSADFTQHCAGLYFLGVHGKTIKDLSVCRELAEHPSVLESVIFYKEGETIDQYGPNPYLARYYIQGESRQACDALTKTFFEKMYVPAVDGTRVDIPFILQED